LTGFGDGMGQRVAAPSVQRQAPFSWAVQRQRLIVEQQTGKRNAESAVVATCAIGLDRDEATRPQGYDAGIGRQNIAVCAGNSDDGNIIRHDLQIGILAGAVAERGGAVAQGRVVACRVGCGEHSGARRMIGAGLANFDREPLGHHDVMRGEIEAETGLIGRQLVTGDGGAVGQPGSGHQGALASRVDQRDRLGLDEPHIALWLARRGRVAADQQHPAVGRTAAQAGRPLHWNADSREGEQPIGRADALHRNLAAQGHQPCARAKPSGERRHAHQLSGAVATP
jgi:hypothetical protein